MAQPQISVQEIDHINQLIESTDVALEFYRRVYGVTINENEIFEQKFGPYDNFVFKLGRQLIEIFCPVPPERDRHHETTDKAKQAADEFRRIHKRFGNLWQAVLWRVPNLEEAIDAFRARNVRLVNVELEPDRRWAFTDPRDTFGMVMQLEDRDEWEKEITPNPLGVTHMKGFTMAVNDAEAAVTFFSDLVSDTDVVYQEERPKLEARAIGLKMDGYTVEFLSPTGPGEVASFLDHYRQRIRTATFVVRSFDQLEQHFKGQGITLREGDGPGTMAVAPEDNLGCQMQFSES
jgi:catechol 2,3-dioxygenase-like lactoylglutathione lyase family enzyme